MSKLLLKYGIMLVSLNTVILLIARTMYKKTKAGLLIYLMASIINALISYKKSEKKKYFNYNILVITIGHAISTVLYFLCIYFNLSSVTYNIYSSVKIPVVSFFSIIMLHRTYTFRQWIGKGVVSFGIVLQILHDELDKSYAIYAALLAGTLSAFSAVYFEYKVKQNVYAVRDYMFTYNLTNLPFNVLFAVIENLMCQNTVVVFDIFFYILVLLNVLLQQLSVNLSIKVDSYERTIVTMASNIISATISDLILNYKVDGWLLFSLLMVSVGTFFYIFYKNEIK